MSVEFSTKEDHMKEFISVIRSSLLFSGISENELSAILSCLDTKMESYPKEAFLLRAGDTVDSIGIVLSGSVLIIQEDVWGNRNILSKAGQGRWSSAVVATLIVVVIASVSVACSTTSQYVFDWSVGFVSGFTSVWSLLVCAPLGYAFSIATIDMVINHCV